MPYTRNEKAVLEVEEVNRALAVARERGPFEYALFAWLYETGARASEPGLQLLKDVDLRANRARAVHLKHGAEREWDALLHECRAALPPWVVVQPQHVKAPQQRPFLFPSAEPDDCYPCSGTGKLTASVKKIKTAVPCYHCDATGKRWGVSRHEITAHVGSILAAAGVEEERRHPHVLRHSIITHLLEAGIPAAVVKERVGHKNLAVTLEYARGTKKQAAMLDGALLKLRGME
jgi:site-specific recombinase XerD